MHESENTVILNQNNKYFYLLAFFPIIKSLIKHSNAIDKSNAIR